MSQQQQAQFNSQYGAPHLGNGNNAEEHPQNEYEEHYQHEGEEYDEANQIHEYEDIQQHHLHDQYQQEEQQEQLGDQHDDHDQNHEIQYEQQSNVQNIHELQQKEYLQQMQQQQQQLQQQQQQQQNGQNRYSQSSSQGIQNNSSSSAQNIQSSAQPQRQFAQIPPNTQVFQPPSMFPQQQQQQQQYQQPQMQQNRLSASMEENKSYQQQQSFTRDQKINSPNKSSKEVMQRVFDDEYSSQTRYRDQRSNHSESNKEDALNVMAYNLSKVKINESANESRLGANQKQNIDKANNSYQQSRNDDGSNLEYNQNQQFNNLEEGEKNNQGDSQINNNNNIMPESIDLSLFDQCYKEFLQQIAGDQGFVDASYEQKIDILINFFLDQQLEYRLGSLIFLFELIYNFRESLTEQAITQILTKIYLNIRHYYETKDFYMVYCALEIIALIGPHSISFNNIKLLASILIDEALPILQDKAFLALVNFDYPGYFALLDIANKEINDIHIYIMNKFAQTEEIQLSVIIPSLQNDINSGDPRKRISSLCALNRMHSMIWKANSLPLLVNLLNEGTIDRQLIVSTIRACGELGEHTLLKILKQTPNQKIKMAISTVLSWRVNKNEKNKLGIRIVPYNIAQHYNINPGTMCIYFGNQTPLAFVEEDYDIEQDYIEINSRDFMAALQRLLAVKYDKFQATQEGYQQQRHNYSAFLNDFTLVKLIDPSVNSEETNPQISQNIIKALCSMLNDENAQVRETSVSTLGLIGLPEAQQAIEPLYESLKDPESQVRAMAAWCLGRLGEVNPPKVAKRLIQLLKDNYWKVRTAACVSIGSLGSQIADIAFPALTKILRDGSINKVTVCETLVRLGVYGEQILIDLLKNVPQSNFKLKTAIIQAFELANVQKPTIDFIIEELFKNASDKMIEVRKACLQTLEILRNRAQDSNITYLKSRNILPLFYFFLQDSSPEIRQLALQSISSFGPQAELMFIEGLTKDKNPIIRQECAKGLGALGVQNFRALLFGLKDVNEGVRKSTALAIKSNFVAEQIIEEFSDKQNQRPALLCNIKDIFALQFYMDEDCKIILEQILQAFGETVYNINNSGNINIINANNNLSQSYGVVDPNQGVNKSKQQSNYSFNYSFDKQNNQLPVTNQYQKDIKLGAQQLKPNYNNIQQQQKSQPLQYNNIKQFKPNNFMN
ncbi:hypothetical protein ABPG74_004548 [Tetrahymena malaccensis]